MRSCNASLIEEGVHRNFPKARKFGLALACSLHAQAVIGHPVIECVRPERVRVIVCDWDGSRGARVVCKSRSGKPFECIEGVVEVWRAKALDGGERDTSEGIERDEVSVDFVQ